MSLPHPTPLSLRRPAALLAAIGLIGVSVGNEGLLPSGREPQVAAAPAESDDGDPVRPLLRSRELAVFRPAADPTPSPSTSPETTRLGVGLAANRSSAGPPAGRLALPHRSALGVWLL